MTQVFARAHANRLCNIRHRIRNLCNASLKAIRPTVFPTVVSSCCVQGLDGEEVRERGAHHRELAPDRQVCHLAHLHRASALGSKHTQHNNTMHWLVLVFTCRREQTQAKHFKDTWGFLAVPGPPTSVSLPTAQALFTLHCSAHLLLHSHLGPFVPILQAQKCVCSSPDLMQ